LRNYKKKKKEIQKMKLILMI